MESVHEQAKTRGGLSTESAPQVVVRGGETFVCLACGVMIRLPDDVVGQVVLPVEASPRPEPTSTSTGQEEPAREGAAEATSPPAMERPQPCERPKTQTPHLEQLPQVAPARERIDGLVVPTTRELERLLAWIDYRLTRLGHLQRWEKQLTPPKARRRKATFAHATASGSEHRPRSAAKKVPLRQRMPKEHSHAELGRAARVNAVQACSGSPMAMRTGRMSPRGGKHRAGRGPP